MRVKRLARLATWARVPDLCVATHTAGQPDHGNRSCAVRSDPTYDSEPGEFRGPRAHVTVASGSSKGTDMSSIMHERYEFADSVPERGAGVSWGAIMAGAVTSAALSLILLALGTGLGLSSVSPWSYQGASANALAPATIGWLVFMSTAASGVGGYVAGRLRTRWQLLHDHEVYFRDTAHGLVSWAVATVITAAALTSAAGSMVGSSLAWPRPAETQPLTPR